MIQVRPEGPRQDATAEQIVRGFLLANVSFADSHEVARAYLTDSLATSWVPTSTILVTRGDPELTTTQEGVVQAQSNVLGELDAEGALTQQPPSTSSTEQFELTEVDGQWRISAFPDDFGLWLTENAFETQFRTASVNYLAPGEDVFVPETRWFSRDEGLPTALARALLAPVPEYLAGAVRTGATEETGLVSSAVPVDLATGTATVNLGGPGLTEDPDQVRALYAQFTSTLSQAAGVRQVELQINGQPVSFPGLDATRVSMEDLGFEQTLPGPGYAVLRVKDSLTAVDPTNYALRDLPREDQEELDLPTVPTQWQGLAMNTEATQYAAVDTERSVLWRLDDGDEVLLEDIGDDLIDPSFGPRGTLWVAGEADTGASVWAIDTAQDASRPARAVDTDWLEPGTVIKAFEVAPDGQRAAIVLREGAQEYLALTAIVRDAEDQPTGLTPPMRIAGTLESIVTVSWASQESLAILGRTSQEDEDSENTPYQLPVGGWLRPLQPEPDATELLGVPADDGFDLFLVTEEGRVFTPEGAGWYPYRNGDELIVPNG
ncbi:MAG: LpqB family beta-propeller domain-containing protein [Ornithinimicrobium sp.]